MNLINAKIKEELQSEDYQEKGFRLGTTPNSLKTRGISNHSIGRNNKVTILGKINN